MLFCVATESPRGEPASAAPSQLFMPSVDDLEDWPALQHPSETATRLTPSDHVPPLKIRLPSMASNARPLAINPVDPNTSGSEYHESNASMDVDVDEEQVPVDEDQPTKEEKNFVTKRGRAIVRRSYKESDGSEADDPSTLDKDNAVPKQEENEGSEEETSRYSLRTRRPKRNKNLAGFVESDDEDDVDDDEDARSGYKTRSKSKNDRVGRNTRANTRAGGITRRSAADSRMSTSRPSRKRMSTRRTRASVDDEGYEDVPSSGSADADGSLDDAPRTSSDHDLDADAEGEVDADAEGDQDQDQENKGYALRKRNPGISYALLPPQEDLVAQPQKSRSAGHQPRRNGSGKSKVPGWSATGAELGRFLGVPQAGDDSVCIIYRGTQKRINNCFVSRILTFLRGHPGSNPSARGV